MTSLLINNDNFDTSNKNHIKLKKKLLYKQIKKLKKQNQILNNEINQKNQINDFNSLDDFIQKDNFFNNNKDNKDNINNLDNLFQISNLTGDFKHNNMIHSFGSNVTQNTKTSQNNKLNIFTGNNNLKKNKKEILNENPKNKENIFGGQNQTEFYKTRYNESRYISNELPFEQIDIGPGLNTNKISSGNFHPDIRKYELPKTVDQLRSKSNPKITFKGKIIHGKKEILRDAEYNFTKFKQNNMFINRDLIKNKSYIPSDITRGSKPLLLSSNNRKHSKNIIGPANKNVKNTPNNISIQDPKKQLLQTDIIRNVNTNINNFDYDKNDYNCSSTKREEQSIMQFKNENYVRNFLEALIPTQHFLDKSKTTIKQTTENNIKDGLNFTGNNKNQIYNKQLPKQTIKQTTIDNTNNILNMKGGNKNQNYNKQLARKTIKETTENNIKDILNIKVYSKLPQNIKSKLKNTLKQTLIYTPRLGNILLNNTNTHNIDLQQLKNTLKTTLKELLINDADLLNFCHINKHTNYLLDKPKITHKQTYVDKDHIGIADKNLGDGYKILNIDMKKTNKQDLCDLEYKGIGNKQTQNAYLTTKVSAKETNKESYTDNQQYGTSKGNNEMMSYEDIYNACINDNKESTLVSREPTLNNVKTINGPDSINLQIKCDLLSDKPPPININRVQNSLPTIDENFNTYESNNTHIDNINDFNSQENHFIDNSKTISDKLEERNITKDLLEQRQDNPYNISII